MRQELLSQLKYLQGKVWAIKADFESEGSTFFEVSYLNELLHLLHLPLAIKLGGIEARNDLYLATLLHPQIIVAPMIETPFALQKFCQMNALTKIDLGINIETVSAVDNLSAILRSPFIRQIRSITIGQVDLLNSLHKKNFDSATEQIIIDALNKIRRYKDLSLTLGGKLTADRLPFVQDLFRSKLIDRVESRKVICCHINYQLLPDIFKFELLWQQFKRPSFDHQQRILLLKKRIRQLYNCK